VREAVAGKENPSPGVEIPARRNQVAEDAVEDPDRPATQIELVVHVRKMEPVSKLGEDQMEIAGITMNRQLRIAAQQGADSTAVPHLGVGWEEKSRLGNLGTQGLELVDDDP